MKHRKLRIAFSVTCAMACLLLIVLWVRSFYIADIAMGNISASTAFTVTSDKGKVGLAVNTAAPNYRASSWHASYVPSIGGGQAWFASRLPAPSVGWFVSVPQLLFASLAAVIGTTPWISWRHNFSLRTLLVATTLAAVLLGTITYTVK
jgi:hypothetical protein